MQILISAFCYVIPFWYPNLWPCIFFFPAFLIQKHISFFHAYLWGLLVSCGHLLPIALAFWDMMHGPVGIKLLPGLFLISTISMLISWWLWLTAHLRSAVLWTLSIWVFLLWIDHAALCIIAIGAGNPFMNPLLIMPLPFLNLLSIMPIPALLLLFACTSSSIGLWMRQPNLITSLCMIILLLPWALSTLLIRRAKKPEWLSSIGYLPIIIPTESDSCALIQHIIQANPHINTLLMPESACSQLPTVHPPINVITGSFLYYKTHRLNVACWINQHDTHFFAKTHTLALAEYLPSWLDWPCIRTSLFTLNCPQTHASNNKRPVWHINNHLIITPYICSELFFTTPSNQGDTIILALCNDWWFTMPHFKKLMALAARLRAIAWHQSILYISYSYGLFFDKFGHTYLLEKL